MTEPQDNIVIDHKFLQWNVRGYYSNYEDIIINLRDHNPIIMCLQETMHGTKMLTSPRNYNIHSNTPASAVPGQGYCNPYP